MLDVKFIIAIAAGGLYVLLVLVSLGIYLYTMYRQEKTYRQIAEMYNSPKLCKMDYDFALYDEDAARIMSVSRQEGQLTIDDVLIDAGINNLDESLEEITGNYKPE